MLLPCGIDVFSGVEFVCCPHNKSGKDTALPMQVETAQQQTHDDKIGNEATVAKDEDVKEGSEDDEDVEEEDEEEDEEEVVDEEVDDGNDEDSYEDNLDEDRDLTSERVDDTKKSQTKDISITTTAAAPVTSSTSPSTSVVTSKRLEIPTATPDYYFSHFDPKKEHEEFKAAEKRLEDNHREKVTKVCNLNVLLGC